MFYVGVGWKLLLAKFCILIFDHIKDLNLDSDLKKP